MPERSEYAPGTPSWVDIGTDVEGAKTFYGSLFGWGTEDAGPPEETGGYGFFTQDGKMVAGYAPQQNPGPPAWATYVTVADADEAALKVEKAGGAVVMPPMEVMTAGRMAVFTDPTGAFFSVWQPGEHAGAQVVNEPGAYCWSELNTRDIDRAKEFYAAVFGWEPATSDGPMEYTEFKLGGESVAGGMALPAEVPAEVPPHWLVYFMVEDVDTALASAQQLGASLVAGPMDIPGGGRFVIVQDPQGGTFGLFRG